MLMFNAIKNKVVLLGFVGLMGDTFFDLRTPTESPTIKQIRNWSEARFKDFGEEVFFYLSLDKGLSNGGTQQNQWGNGENDWEKALKSDDENVRALVALNGKFREVTSKDASPLVRYMTVESLLKDKAKLISSYDDRYWLTEMLNDTDAGILELIAKYGLKDHIDVLIKNDFESVRMAAATKANVLQLNHLVNDPSENVRALVATYGNAEQQEMLINDESEIVRCAVAKNCASWHSDMLINDTSQMVKIALIESDNHIGKFVTDNDFVVRMAVAEHCHDDRAEPLLNDENAAVRMVLAKQYYYSNLLVNDPDEKVRAVAAKYCDRHSTKGEEKYLPILLKDPSPNVRLEVARRGYGLTELSKDEDYQVSSTATTYPVDLYKMFAS